VPRGRNPRRSLSPPTGGAAIQHRLPEKAASRKRRLPKTLTREEAKRLLAAPNVKAPTGLRHRCMLELMYRSGLRVGEVCALTRRDVDIAGGTIRVHDGKGGDGTAYFPADSVGPFVDEWIRVRKRLGLGIGGTLFCTLEGEPVSVRDVQKMVRRMARRADISSTCTPHTLRHSFATELLDEGFTIREVQDALRHADVSTTMIYTHVLNSALRDRIQRRRSG
jgi:integrase/recombinase XerD